MYYYARSYEVLGNIKNALKYYNKLFAIDMNYKDIRERIQK